MQVPRLDTHSMGSLGCRLGWLALLGAVLAGSCGDDRSASGPAPAAAGPAMFRDVTEERGVVFRHEVVLGGDFALPEIMGSGCAVFDGDGDGDLDLYFVNYGTWGGSGAANVYLRRNDAGRYEDATEASGLGDRGHGFGVAVGDVDNDGDLDLYVTNDGPDVLYVNDGTGRFEDRTAAAGIAGDHWSTSAGFFDYDGDGLLDLYVVHYVAFDPAIQCTLDGGERDFCSPNAFAGVADTLYRNRGDGTFADVSESAGIGARAANGLGIVFEDFDGDGDPDVFVANDGEANQLWINDGVGRFEDCGFAMGVAVNAFGAAEAGMGVVADDLDGDGDFDLFMTHLKGESNTLYCQDPDLGFVDATAERGLGVPSLQLTGFGVVAGDFDLDGDLDLAVANGRVGQGDPWPGVRLDPLWSRYAEPNQLFLNDGVGRFAERPDPTGFASALDVSRGLAAADLDGDGDLDLVVTACRGPARVYENVIARAGAWLTVRAVDRAIGRDAYGAVVVVRVGERRHRRTIGPCSSYLTAAAGPAHFGLGTADRVDEIEVVWPGGRRESFPGGATSRAVVLGRGEGRR